MKDEKEYMWVMWGLGMGLVLSLIAISLPDVALAQGSSDWVKPASDLVADLQSGLVQIGIPIVGLGLIIFGIWGAVTGRLDWQRMAMIAVAGLLITAGPAIITSLLS